MGQFIDLTGNKYTRLEVLRRGPNADSQHVVVQWWCRCDCGKELLVVGGNLKSGRSQSCGCLRDETSAVCHTTHGHTTNGKQSLEYRSWYAMHKRCNNPKATDYKYYGGRGIKVCNRWNKFENFLRDMGPCPIVAGKRKTVDRINNDGD